MSLKRLIKERQILESGVLDNELVLPGEPMIYSIKYDIGSRKHSAQFLRDQKWGSLIKSYFRAYMKTNAPVALTVRFYVSPPDWVLVKDKDLKKESIPAVCCYEVADYLLSFMEMIHHVLINSYKQIVSVNVEKFYSSNPRTVFKFMHWNQHVKIQDKDSLHPKTEGVCAPHGKRSLQPKRKGNEQDAPVRKEQAARPRASPAKRASSGGGALSPTGPFVSPWQKKATAAYVPSYKKA